MRDTTAHNRHHQYHRNNSNFSMYSHERRHHDGRNIENIYDYDSQYFSLSTSFRSMPIVDASSTQCHDSPHGDYQLHQEQEEEERRQIFVDEIEAPSDERDEDDRIYEMNLPTNHNIVHTPPKQTRTRRLSSGNVSGSVSSTGGSESNVQDCDRSVEGEETEEERRLREEEESEALARRLMAEEAMASYAQSTNFLQAHANEYSEEDLRALQALMAEEDPMNDEVDEEEHESEELSYDALLRLGEQIGDVKSERWAMKARDEIEKLPTVRFCKEMAMGKDENDCSVKCLVCQYAYEEDEKLRVLPCGHIFHCECIDEWLLTKDHCPYCRQSILDKNA